MNWIRFDFFDGPMHGMSVEFEDDYPEELHFLSNGHVYGYRLERPYYKLIVDGELERPYYKLIGDYDDAEEPE